MAPQHRAPIAHAQCHLHEGQSNTRRSWRALHAVAVLHSPDNCAEPPWLTPSSSRGDGAQGIWPHHLALGPPFVARLRCLAQLGVALAVGACKSQHELPLGLWASQGASPLL